MIETLQESDLYTLDRRYYRGRWPYYAEAIRQLHGITGIHAADQVIELGPYLSPIVRGCHIMDCVRHGPEATYLHDADCHPWPVANKRYRAFVGLQVLEHLADKRAAWEEIRRVAAWAIISLPFKWPLRTKSHASIARRTIYDWTGQIPVTSKIVQTPGRPDLPRIVNTYRLDG